MFVCNRLLFEAICFGCIVGFVCVFLLCPAAMLGGCM